MYTHVTSSLPSLLDEYLPPLLKRKDDKAEQDNPQKNGERGKHRRALALDEDEEDLNMKATKKAHQEQRCLEIYKNMHRLYKTLRLRYMDLLSKKVQRQRHEIKERDLRFQQRKEQNSTRPLLGHHSECSQLHCDSKHLKSIPKSHYYMIVELQDQLIKSGILKNQEDYEEFWWLLKQNFQCSQFETKLQDVKLKMNRSLPNLKTRHAHHDKSPHAGRMKNNPLTTSELPELPSVQIRNHPKSKLKKVHEESEQVFPKMTNLKQMQETPCRKLAQLDKLYQMYNHSIANMTVAQRLLKRNGHLTEFKEPTVQDFYCSDEGRCFTYAYSMAM
ncbi:uncharacterized protein [Narcine bancroftii]|uniref:uncharacterized protein isoform X3 n=1 Tax=Narcine bancroftii TaxID=1343680 RepID=UPI0038317238